MGDFSNHYSGAHFCCSCVSLIFYCDASGSVRTRPFPFTIAHPRPYTCTRSCQSPPLLCVECMCVCVRMRAFSKPNEFRWSLETEWISHPHIQAECHGISLIRTTIWIIEFLRVRVLLTAVEHWCRWTIKTGYHASPLISLKNSIQMSISGKCPSQIAKCAIIR